MTTEYTPKKGIFSMVTGFAMNSVSLHVLGDELAHRDYVKQRDLLVRMGRAGDAFEGNAEQFLAALNPASPLVH